MKPVLCLACVIALAVCRCTNNPSTAQSKSGYVLINSVCGNAGIVVFHIDSSDSPGLRCGQSCFMSALPGMHQLSATIIYGVAEHTWGPEQNYLRESEIDTIELIMGD
jgi:hypothetical protein